MNFGLYIYIYIYIYIYTERNSSKFKSKNQLLNQSFINIKFIIMQFLVLLHDFQHTVAFNLNLKEMHLLAIDNGSNNVT